MALRKLQHQVSGVGVLFNLMLGLKGQVTSMIVKLSYNRDHKFRAKQIKWTKVEMHIQSQINEQFFAKTFFYHFAIL